MTEQGPALVDDLRTLLLPALADYGFEVRVLSYTPAVFGNCVVELFATAVVLTVTMDRGQVFFDVASASQPELKYWLGELVAFLAGERAPRAITTLDGAVAALQAGHGSLFSNELLLGRSSELRDYRKAFNERRWGQGGTKPRGAS